MDDPIAAIRGTPERRKEIIVLSVASWLALGLPLSLHKAARGQLVKWIGMLYRVNTVSKTLTVTVPEDKLEELTDITTSFLKRNVINKKSFHTYVGKLASIASLLFTIRPFLGELYATLHDKTSQAPKNCVWTTQCAHSLCWLLVFLRSSQGGPMERVFNIDAHLTLGVLMTLAADASPWGLGVILIVDGVIVGWFAVAIQRQDEIVLKTPSGDCKGQQVWEALSVLVALRLWAPLWQHRRMRLRIRSDNMTALAMVEQLKGKGHALGTIAREMALDIADASYEPDSVQHLPGIMNDIPDKLSRKYEPNKPYEVPQLLANAKECFPPSRTLSWWKSYQEYASWRPSVSQEGNFEDGRP